MRLFDFFEDEADMYLVMELVPAARMLNDHLGLLARGRFAASSHLQEASQKVEQRSSLSTLAWS